MTRTAPSTSLLLLAIAGSSGCDSATGHDHDHDHDHGDAALAEIDGGPGSDGPAVFVPCPGAIEPGATGLTGVDLLREAPAGSIDVAVVFCNPLIAPTPAELLFYVTLTNHQGLTPSDLSVGTSVSTSGGLRLDGPFPWDGDDLTLDDHHAKGHLRPPDHTSDGTPMIGPDTLYLELTLGGIGGDGTITVRWDQAYLR